MPFAQAKEYGIKKQGGIGNVLGFYVGGMPHVPKI
jgi:hypothetical protein